LEHLDKPKETLKNLNGLLTENSVGFISVPNFSSNRIDGFIKDINQGKSVIKEINPWGHLNYFTPKSLRQMLREADFSEIQAPLKFRADITTMNSDDNPRPVWHQFLQYQYKAVRALLRPQIIDNTKSDPHSTSVYVKTVKR
jgi:hypothetical protein